MQKSYYIITIGCQMNKSDSERIASCLDDFGFKRVDDRKTAGYVILTTCGVRQSAEDRVYGLVNKIKKNNPKTKIILTGCLSEREDVRRRLKNSVDIWLPIKELPDLKIKIINRKPENISEREKNYLKIKPKYDSKISAFVPIGNGCDNFCAYCVVPYARGREVYRPAKEILEEVKGLIDNGYKEIILIAQNVNSYKTADKNSKVSDFPDLLKIVNNIPGDFWIRFATSHPKDMSDKLIRTISECEKVCRHIHLPVQAGDDEILARMNRKYTRGDYIILVNKIRKTMPDAAITTDTIVGFPGETKKQFNNTVKLYKEIKFDMAYIAQYSPRFGTAASKMKDDVSRDEKKKREETLMKILRKTALENNKKHLNKSVDVLIAGKGRKGEWSGYTRTAKNVKVKSDDLNLSSGEVVKVRIRGYKDFGLEGECENLEVKK